MSLRVSTSRGTALAWLAMALLAAGACAPGSRGLRRVPIDSRPTPPQPTDATAPATGATAAPAQRSHVSDAQNRALKARVAADTLAARRVLAHCARLHLEPEGDSTVESANRLLGDTRAALAAGDVVRAESLARQARQLTRSLDCP
jgi:hypothetical protein